MLQCLVWHRKYDKIRTFVKWTNRVLQLFLEILELKKLFKLNETIFLLYSIYNKDKRKRSNESSYVTYDLASSYN